MAVFIFYKPVLYSLTGQQTHETHCSKGVAQAVCKQSN